MRHGIYAKSSKDWPELKLKMLEEVKTLKESAEPKEKTAEQIANEEAATVRQKVLPKAVKEVEDDAFGFVDYGDEFEDDDQGPEENAGDFESAIGKKVQGVNELQKAEIAQY